MNDKTTYNKDFYTLEQLSQEIDIRIPSLRKFIKNKELKASKVGNRYIIKKEDVIEWLNNNKV